MRHTLSLSTTSSIVTNYNAIFVVWAIGMTLFLTAQTTSPRDILSTTPVSWRASHLCQVRTLLLFLFQHLVHHFSYSSLFRCVGSALRTEGQLTVYHFNNGPCYRCIFPVPPPADAVTNCSDGGVLGPVPGVIGVLQAMEALKILSGFGGCLSSQLLLYDAATTRFRNAKLRNRNPACIVCGDAPTITSATPLPDYAYFCGSPLHDKGTQTFQGEEQAALLASLQPTQPRLSAKEYVRMPFFFIGIYFSFNTDLCFLL